MTKIFLAELSAIELFLIIFANFSSLLKSVPTAAIYPDIFLERLISAGRLRAALTPLINPGQSPGWETGWEKSP